MSIALSHKRSDKTFLIILIIASALFNFALLEYNNYRINRSNPQHELRNAASLVYEQTIFSIDNEYYLTPVDNYLAGNGWRRAPAVGDGDYLRRVPGYSIVYFGFVKIFGKPAAHFLIKLFQLFLFLSTIPLVFFLCKLIGSDFSSRVVSVIYGFIPFISSWAYFTLTESITPFLTLVYIFLSVKGITSDNEKKKLKYYLGASFFFIAAVLTRPYIALAGLGQPSSTPAFHFMDTDFSCRAQPNSPDRSFPHYSVVSCASVVFMDLQ